MQNTKISVRVDADPFSRDKICLGDLTDKQYESLQKVALLSPGYTFTVVRYAGGPTSRATHVLVSNDGNDQDHVGLVGRDTAQYYDGSKETEKVILRVAHRVYRKSVHFSTGGQQ